MRAIDAFTRLKQRLEAAGVTFEDDGRELRGRGEYAGMNGLMLDIECDRAPEGRVPKAQRWGYAGRRRDDVSDESHPEMQRWAGWVDSWKTAVEASNSFKVLDDIPPARWRVVQSDY